MIEPLISRTLSDNIPATKLLYEEIYSKIQEHYPVYFDVLALTNANNKVQIIHSEDRSYYHYIDNVIKFDEASVFLHEATHAAMQSLFHNTALPYPPNHELKLKYDLAVNQVLSRIANKIGVQISTDSVSEALAILKQETILDLFATMAMPSFTSSNFDDNYQEELGEELINALHDKYLPEIHYDLIINALIQNIQYLDIKLDEGEMRTISIIGRVIYLSSEESLYKELIATLPESYFENFGDDSILSPIHEYWVNNIHPLVNSEYIGANYLSCTIELTDISPLVGYLHE